MKSFTTIFGLMLVLKLSAQDPNFSQFYNNPVYYNSAMTAINNGITFRANARCLWGPIPGRFNTYSAGLEAQTVYKMGLGVQAYSDVAGEALLRSTGAYLNYSYRPVDTRNLIVQLGASGGLVTKSIDWSKLTFSDQLDETLGNIHSTAFSRPNYKSVSYADFNTGIVMRLNGKPRKSGRALRQWSGTAGFAVHHLSNPADGFLAEGRLPMRFVGHIGVNLLVNDLILSPGVIYEQQNEFQTFTAGFNFTNQPLTLGLWFRNRTAALRIYDYDSFIFNVGVNLPSRVGTTWKIMYGYDLTMSRLKTSSYGTHELTLVGNFEDMVLFAGRLKKKNLKRRYQCPDEFRGQM